MRKNKILVVDDDEDTRQLIEFSLKKAGYAVGTACDGVEALKKVCSVSPDLVLVDLMMPEMDGFAVCEVLRSNPMTASLPIIIVTAMTGHLTRMSGIEAGANDYLTKPFSPKQLVSRVEKVLSHPTGTDQ